MSFTFRQKVLFRHCDPAGIVFYPRYFEILNDGVEALFSDKLNHPFDELHRGAAVPTVQLGATFSAPSRHGDDLIITIAGTRLGRSSLDLTFAAVCADELRFTASVTLVYINETGRAVPWPGSLKQSLATFTGEIDAA